MAAMSQQVGPQDPETVAAKWNPALILFTFYTFFPGNLSKCLL